MIILVPVVDSQRAYDLSVGDVIGAASGNGLDSQRVSRAPSRSGSVASFTTTVSARGRQHERIVDKDDFDGDGVGEMAGLGYRRKGMLMKVGKKVDKGEDRDMYAEYLRKGSDDHGKTEIATVISEGSLAGRYKFGSQAG